MEFRSPILNALDEILSKDEIRDEMILELKLGSKILCWLFANFHGMFTPFRKYFQSVFLSMNFTTGVRRISTIQL